MSVILPQLFASGQPFTTDLIARQLTAHSAGSNPPPLQSLLECRCAEEVSMPVGTVLNILMIRKGVEVCGVFSTSAGTTSISPTIAKPKTEVASTLYAPSVGCQREKDA